MNSNTRRTMLLVALAILATAFPAWAQDRYNCKGDNSADWAATPGTISINLGGTGDSAVSMTSPKCLNTYPAFPGSLTVYTDVKLDSAVCPDGSSGTTATCTLIAPVASISPDAQTYDDFGQTKIYNVHFDAANATAGTYAFQVHANASDPDEQHLNGDALDGVGWGYGSGAALTVTVTKPSSTCDPTEALNVSFSQPQTGNVKFCNGGTTIPVSAIASDTSNLIKSLLVSVNSADITGSLSVAGIGTTSATATGNYTAGPVGAYLFEANATTACTQSSGSATVKLIYDISGLLGPLANGQKPKKGHTIPIQFNPKDCSGNPVPQDSTVEVKVYGSKTMDATPTACSGTGCGNGTSSFVTWSATTGYQANFDTDSTAGTYTLEIWFGGVLNYTNTFITQ